MFAELYPSLRRFAGVVRPAEVDADDLVQEALARTLAVRALADCHDPGAYLRTAIVRLAANHRRSLGRRGCALARLTAEEMVLPPIPRTSTTCAGLLRRTARCCTSRWSKVGPSARSRKSSAAPSRRRVRARRALKRLRIELTAEQQEITDA